MALRSVAEQVRAVTDGPVLVLKLQERSCRSCIGLAPCFKRARVYAGRARFFEMEYGAQPNLAAELGVNQLPFFAVWRAGHLVTAEPIGFSRIGCLSEH